MKGTCKLCDKEATLKLSHVIPASIYNWIKSTSGTGILRQFKNINKPVQDGFKFYWLCEVCEHKIGTTEKYFIENIFRPVNNGKYVNQFDYDERFFYFLCSIWWRIIQVSLTEDEVLNSKHISNIRLCEKELKDFLNEYRYPINFDKNYLLLLGEIDEAPEQYTNLNFIFLRTVDPLLMFDEDSCYLSLRIPHFYFFGNITGLKDEMLKAVKLNSGKGKYIVSPEMVNEPHISSFIHQRISVFNEYINKVSSDQVNKTTERHIKNKDRFLKSKSFEAWIADREREEK